jgi:hypothetical protein
MTNKPKITDSKKELTTTINRRGLLFPRIAGMAILGVFVLNLYIALYDGNLSQFSTLHYYLNWLLAAATLVAGLLLLAKPSSKLWVSLSGITWPIVYFAGLVADVSSKLCLGTGTNCWPDTNTAFQYLILNNANIPNGFGWTLWQYTIPTAIFLLVVSILASAIGLSMLRTRRSTSQASSNDGATKAANVPAKN